MTRFAIVLLPAFACVSLFGRGDSKNFKSDAATPEQQVLAVEQQWADAEVKHDSASLSRILDDRFVVSYASGQPLDKAAFIAQAMRLSMTSQTVSHDAVRIYGNIAIIVGDTIVRSPNSTEPAQSYRYTTVYLKRRGRWVGVAEQLGSGRPADPAPGAGAGNPR